MPENVVHTVEAYREATARVMPGASEYDVELASFGNLPIGHPAKHIFALSCMKFQWGDWLQLKNGEYSNYWFKRIIRIACRNRWIWACGSASSGKSFAFAAYLYTAWKSRCWCTSGIVSSTSRDALQQRAWGILKKMHTLDRYKVGMRLDYKDSIVLQDDKSDKDRLMENSIMAVALPKGSEGEKAIGEIQGRKNTNVIWLADEYSHMDGTAVQTARGNLAANQSFQFFACSNKPEEGDPMFQDAEPFGEGFEKGWETENIMDRKSWPTRLGICIYLNGDESPNLKSPDGQPAPFPMLAKREYREELIRMDGIDDGPLLWRWWKAFPKSGELQDRVMTPRILESFGATQPVMWGPEPSKCIAGLDLGFKADGDMCAASFGKVGLTMDAVKVLAHDGDSVHIAHSMTSTAPYETQIAIRFLDECAKRDCHIVALDISGSGGLMALPIGQEARNRGYSLDVIPVDFGGTPSDEMYDVGGKKEKAKTIFDRRVSELWYSYRLAVQNRIIRGISTNWQSCRELCERRVIQDENRRWKVEKKSDMKKRLRRSPDKGDSLILCHTAARHAGLSGSTTIDSTSKTQYLEGFDDPKERRSYGRSHQQSRQYNSFH